MMKSRFDLGVITPLLLFLFLSFGIGVLATLIFTNLMSISIYLFFILFIVVWLWLLLIVLRRKITAVRIDGGTIVCRGFFGLGISSTYLLAELDGFKTTMVASKGGVFENLYLLKEERKVIRISANYHRNYAELKVAIAEHAVDLGFENYHIKNEIKEIFN